MRAENRTPAGCLPTRELKSQFNSEKGTTRNLRIERTAIHAVLPQGSRVLEPLPTSKDDDRRAQPLAHPVASMTATARLLADHELIITAPIVGGYVVPTRSSTCHSRVGALSRSPCCKGRGNRGVRCSSSERRQGERQFFNFVRSRVGTLRY